MQLTSLADTTPFLLNHLNQIKQDIISYYESGTFEREVSHILSKAQQKIETYLSSHQSTKQKLAVVLDIDETSLSNYNALKKADFSNADDVWQIIVASTIIPANKPMLHFYNYLIKKDLNIFFITARRPKYRQQTAKALSNAGYSSYHGLTLLPQDYTQTNYAPFKTNSRLAIIKQGYSLLLNIGDQDSDLTNSNALFNIKLPNYMY